MDSMTNGTWRNMIFTSVLMTILAVGAATADVVNGDFENGGSDWTDTTPPGFGTSYPPVGGNGGGGYAELTSSFQNPGGQVCITQTFDCGDPTSGTECTIGIDYKLVPVDAVPGSARITVDIDGNTDTITDMVTNDWELVTYVVPCGSHTITICLEVDPSDNAWIASLDNIRAICTGSVAETKQTWSSIKALYR